MTLALSTTLRATMLNGLETFMDSSGGTATLVLLQTNTVLATFSLATTPFAAASLDSIIVTSPPISVSAVATGTANSFQLKNEASVLGLSGTISTVGGGGDIEVPNVAVTSGSSQRLNTLIVRMTSTGALFLEASLTLQ